MLGRQWDRLYGMLREQRVIIHITREQRVNMTSHTRVPQGHGVAMESGWAMPMVYGTCSMHRRLPVGRRGHPGLLLRGGNRRHPAEHQVGRGMTADCLKVL